MRRNQGGIISGITALVLAIAVSIAIAVLPVMFAARFVGAGRTTLGWVFLAVVVQSAVSGVVNRVVISPLWVLVIAVVASSAIYAFILETTFLKGLLIGVRGAFGRTAREGAIRRGEFYA